MTLLDAYALVAFLIGGPAQTRVQELLREGNTGIATVNLVEALEVSERVYGLPVADAVRSIEPLFTGPMVALTLDLATARRAAELRARHYHRSHCSISLADAILIATTGPGDRLATADPDVLAVAKREQIDMLSLPGQG
ncbi:MAG TPA: PIN domain-containing protein [Gaiellaceae bacterium]|nr:PIN domain-containing protein [Gaiellaceae bacterium]